MAFSAQFDLTAATPALKELYNDQVVHNLVYKDAPTLALIKKNTDFGGKYKPIPIINGASQGRSASFANAQANISAVAINEFLITSVADYSIAQITGQVLRQMNSDKKAFLMGVKTVVDGAFRSASRSLSSGLFRSGTGSIGQVSTTTAPSSGVITLQDPSSVVQFELNQVLQANATDGGGSPRAALGYVVAVDRSAGTVTVSASAQGGSAGNPAGWTTSDFLLMQGDNNAKMKGFAAWLPPSAPSATAFFGVDRSTDPTRLGGNRVTGSNEAIEEALIDAAILVGREGGSPDVAVMGYTSFGALEKALGTRVQYTDLKGPAGISFRGIIVNSPTGFIKVFPDRDCPAQTCYLLQLETWALESAGETPGILTYEDGLTMLRSATSDSAEVRVGGYQQLAGSAPGWNAYVSLAQ